MRRNVLGQAGSLLFISGLAVWAAPAAADLRLPPPTIVRIAPPPGSIGFGEAVAGVGDMNGDRIADVLVGAPGSDHAYVVSGGTGAIVRDVVSPAAVGLRFGDALASLGDVDRDGVADFAVGAPSDPSLGGPLCPSSPQCGALLPGRAFAFSGRSGTLIWELVPTSSDDRDFGRSVTGPGDLSGDGVPDIVVGAPGQTTGPGNVLAFSGADGAQLWSRLDPSRSFGELVVSTPDLTGDGFADVLVSTISSASGPQKIDLLGGLLDRVLAEVVPDRVHILSGTTGAIVRVLSDPTPMGKDAFGATMVPAGDQDGDGIIDHIISESGARQLHLYSGRGGVLMRSLAAPAEAGGRGTFALAHVDDKDGDGRDDFWVGIGSARAVFLMHGPGTLLSSAIGPSALGAFAAAVGTVGNIGGDPGADLVVGDPAEPGGGAAYLLHLDAGASPAATLSAQAGGCSGAACEGTVRLRAQTTVPTTTTALTAAVTEATTGEAPATASLPKPAGATAGLPGTGGLDLRVVGLGALAVGLTGITLLRRLREPSLRRPSEG